MRIEEDLKLDFKDVLIRPKRSEAKSRKDVVLDRKYTFRNGTTWEGIPIIAANMDGVGTFEMSRVLNRHGLMTCLVKSYEYDDYVEKCSEIVPSTTILSTGISLTDLERTQNIVDDFKANIEFVCIDVANGYSEYFVDFVRRFKERNPYITLIAGNVVTADMTQELILAGADIVKVGIGPGCFAKDSLVQTKCGLKPIQEVEIGEEVLTHKNRFRKVLNTFIHKNKESFVKVNNIKATPNHEFYVLHKNFKDKVSDDNIHDFAEWVCAEDLIDDFLLLEMQ